MMHNHSPKDLVRVTHPSTSRERSWFHCNLWFFCILSKYKIINKKVSFRFRVTLKENKKNPGLGQSPLHYWHEWKTPKETGSLDTFRAIPNRYEAPAGIEAIAASHILTACNMPSPSYFPRFKTFAKPRRAPIGSMLPVFCFFSLSRSSKISVVSLSVLSATRSAISLVVAIACTPCAN